ncbi:thioesterase domain-containing protein [Elsinoe australis]|uniref:Thioesterase domain-containing protein n=1 Tax=Elsinoe australis TaxID=40998 RepID=A0A4U7AVI4_9PEZI|nr:thioesterase domain-containing protein [Elsinoe australis]
MDTCVEIQSAPPASDSTPLFLVHDGGGTIFSYHLVDDLGRAVYGISNPNFDSRSAFNGSIHDMATLYVSFIRSRYPKGDILLGGWSLGGMLSLEMAAILAEDPDLRVKGMIFIDSPYPKTSPPSSLEVISSGIVFSDATRAEMREKINRSMDSARRMIQDWTLPTWTTSQPPPTILLRARESVHPQDSGKIARVDFARADSDLGWGNYSQNFIRKTIDIPGAHYSVFKFDYLEELSEKLRIACALVDQPLTSR